MAGTGEKGERRECGERDLWDFRRERAVVGFSKYVEREGERAVGMCAFKYINFNFFL